MSPQQLDETRQVSCWQEEVFAPTSGKKKEKVKKKIAWSHAMSDGGRACTPMCRQGWTCTDRCLWPPLKGEVQPWIIGCFHFKTNMIFNIHTYCVFLEAKNLSVCLFVCLFHSLTSSWCRQPALLFLYRALLSKTIWGYFEQLFTRLGKISA